jgi:thiamine-monophosphate kinase
VEVAVKLAQLGEFEFIDRITPGCLGGDRRRVIQGIGDDAAVVEVPDGCQLLTTDVLVEGVHFLRDNMTLFQLGYKALAVSLSDIAAMGGTPLDAYVSIAVPVDLEVEELDRLYDGIKELAHAQGVNLLGGDTTSSRQDLYIHVVLTGSAPREQILYRSGARPGDRILLTGTLGDSAGGLELLRTAHRLPKSVSEPLIAAHRRPQLYLEEARILAASGLAHSAIDVSDGLASDLRHICARSGVGAVIESGSIPISDELRELCRVLGKDPLRFALSGGEDYRLLVSVDPAGVEPLRQKIASATGRALYEIGKIVPGTEITLYRTDGTRDPLSESGWDSFLEHWSRDDS